MEVIVVLSSMGTTTNSIPATAFGVTKILSCSPLINNDNDEIAVAAPSYDGSKILLKTADTVAPADFTGTFRGVILALNT